ncbi:hypothetical protein BDN67DRAFT_966675 [Paxillus ammoniavirescens]|nr:hypothetical protein BDN67DRAFT_966675 [Paxillus ammoniavirescens]
MLCLPPYPNADLVSTRDANYAGSTISPLALSPRPLISCTPAHSSNSRSLLASPFPLQYQTQRQSPDWRVAEAYVALADDPEEEGAYAVKLKEVGGTGAGGSNLQARAVDQYLEDQEWEEEQRKTGRGVNVNTIPPFFFGKITA